MVLQVNTSGEGSKGGVKPADAAAVCAHVHSDACPGLVLKGLMCIGVFACISASFSLSLSVCVCVCVFCYLWRCNLDDVDSGAIISSHSWNTGAGQYGADSSDDFNTLIACRDSAAVAIGVDAKALGLSMGMSHDFEQAIE